MARRIAPTRTTRLAGIIDAALVSALIVCAAARAQTPPPAANVAATPAAAALPSPLSKACQPGSAATANESPLRNVAAALERRKSLRILAFGAAPGRVSARGGYTKVIEAMLTHALDGIGVVMINRGVSGELAAGAAIRMKNEVAFEEPDLVLWQVGTNDALAYVSVDEFVATVKDQIDWLKAHNVDVVLVGLQFAKEMLRDAHYIDIRESLRRVAAQENVIVVRFFEAMQIINQATLGSTSAASDEIEHNEAGYNCLAQYVARAITLGVFGKNMPKQRPPTPKTPTPAPK